MGSLRRISMSSRTAGSSNEMLGCENAPPMLLTALNLKFPDIVPKE